MDAAGNFQIVAEARKGVDADPYLVNHGLEDPGVSESLSGEALD